MNGHSAHTPARIAFRVLGPLEVEGPDGQPIDVCGGKPATMLTLLLLHRNAWVSTEPADRTPSGPGGTFRPRPSATFKTYVWQLRRALPDERIESRPGAYRVRVLAGELDADIAADLSGPGTQAAHRRYRRRGRRVGRTRARPLARDARTTGWRATRTPPSSD